MTQHFDVIIIGGGAAGLFCAAQAGQKGLKTIILDHAAKLGEKIRISGGGRCNFTNIHTQPDRYLSQNRHFCISALRRFSAQDFIKKVQDHKIAYHEKTLGQLFCDHSAQDILKMLFSECEQGKVRFQLSTKITGISKSDSLFQITTSSGIFNAPQLVIATGGKSIPKMGATGFGYQIAEQFGHKIEKTRAGLVPFTYDPQLLQIIKPLAGNALPHVTTAFGKQKFEEAALFTHKGLSGPAILQISSYWQAGKQISIDLLPQQNCQTLLKEAKDAHPKQTLAKFFQPYFTRKICQSLPDLLNFSPDLLEKRLADLSHKQIDQLSEKLHHWRTIPMDTEGYRTAEVTVGGVDTKSLSSKTMESQLCPGLYFIGEVVDVTGHLGGYNFQWAWSSAYAAAENLQSPP